MAHVKFARNNFKFTGILIIKKIEFSKAYMEDEKGTYP